MEETADDTEFRAKIARATAASSAVERNTNLRSFVRGSLGQLNVSERASLDRFTAGIVKMAEQCADEIDALPADRPVTEPGPIARAMTPTASQVASSIRSVHAVARDAASDGLTVVDRISAFLDRLASSAVFVSEWSYSSPGVDSDADPAVLARILVAAPGAPSLAVLTTV